VQSTKYVYSTSTLRTLLSLRSNNLYHTAALGPDLNSNLTMASHLCLRRAMSTNSLPRSMLMPQALRSSSQRTWQLKLLSQRSLLHSRTPVLSAISVTYPRYTGLRLLQINTTAQVADVHRNEWPCSRAVGVSFMQQRSYGVYPREMSVYSTKY